MIGTWVLEKNWKDRLETPVIAGKSTKGSKTIRDNLSRDKKKRPNSRTSMLITGTTNETYDFVTGVLGSGQVFDKFQNRK
jgi:hypothetical protein